ncbi:hypothetical protein E4U54_007173, partial [Claviceps lovelessii]
MTEPNATLRNAFSSVFPSNTFVHPRLKWIFQLPRAGPKTGASFNDGKSIKG